MTTDTTGAFFETAVYGSYADRQLHRPKLRSTMVKGKNTTMQNSHHSLVNLSDLAKDTEG